MKNRLKKILKSEQVSSNEQQFLFKEKENPIFLY